jgi:hypothetical protein
MERAVPPQQELITQVLKTWVLSQGSTEHGETAQFLAPQVYVHRHEQLSWRIPCVVVRYARCYPAAVVSAANVEPYDEYWNRRLTQLLEAALGSQEIVCMGVAGVHNCAKTVIQTRRQAKQTSANRTIALCETHVVFCDNSSCVSRLTNHDSSSSAPPSGKTTRVCKAVKKAVILSALSYVVLLLVNYLVFSIQL